MTVKKDITIQLEQKIIHYRAEISHFEQRLAKMEWELKKEKVRNQYLQKELYEIEHVHIQSYEKEIHRLKEKLLTTEVMLEEEKERKKGFIHEEVSQQKQPKIIKLQAFFNYAFLLSDYHDEESPLSAIGDLAIQNIGTEPLHDILVCIRIKPKQAGQLSGKISRARADSRFDADAFEQWQFIHENYREKIRTLGEYWIKPTKVKELKPSNQLDFTNFELTLQKPQDQHSVIVEGFVYCKEIQQGISVLNKIVVNY